MVKKVKDKKEPLLSDDIGYSDARFQQSASSSTIDAMELGEDGSTQREKKIGHRFFFCCCDTKRAVVWLNMVIFLLNLLTITAAIMRIDPSTDGYIQAMVIRVCGMFVTLATIFGAFWYSKSTVFVGLVFACYQMTALLIKLTRFDGETGEESKLEVVVPLFVNMMVIYAEAAFISEVNAGILTPETYKKRERACCCFNI